MKRSLPWLFLFAVSPLAGCTWSLDRYFLDADDALLAIRDSGGVKQTFRLQMQGDAALQVITERDEPRVGLGLDLAELDKPAAERRGVKPYAGLLVRSAGASAAKDGGVLAGDVLLRVDAAETVYLAQVAAIEATLKAGQQVAARVLRGQVEIDVGLTATGTSVRTSATDLVPLETPAASERPYAGVTLGGIPAAWCERIYGAPRQAAVVVKIEVGSPAWLAGLRPGDVIDSVDGAPVPDVHELMRRIATKGEAGQTMTFGVRRGSGPVHEGQVELSDYSDDSQLLIPLVFHCADGVYQDRWSVGPFGLVMSHRSRYIPDATSRQVKTRSVFSAVIGLFRVESTPDETEVRLLWFIRFDT